jgi:hypothetical protein
LRTDNLLSFDIGDWGLAAFGGLVNTAVSCALGLHASLVVETGGGGGTFF